MQKGKENDSSHSGCGKNLCSPAGRRIAVAVICAAERNTHSARQHQAEGQVRASWRAEREPKENGGWIQKGIFEQSWMTGQKNEGNAATRIAPPNPNGMTASSRLDNTIVQLGNCRLLWHTVSSLSNQN